MSPQKQKLAKFLTDLAKLPKDERKEVLAGALKKKQDQAKAVKPKG